MKPIHFAYAAAALALFQVFFRYSYTTTTAGPVYRFDRLTQRACIIGPIDRCDATPTPIPTPTATPSLELEDQRAIAMVQNRSDARSDEISALQEGGGVYTWQVDQRYTNEEASSKVPGMIDWRDAPNPKASAVDWSGAADQPLPVRLVWYEHKAADGSERGWAWEVHLDTREVFPVIGNAALEAKYTDQSTPKPSKSATR